MRNYTNLLLHAVAHESSQTLVIIIDKFWNKSENMYRNYNKFSANFVEIIKVFK